MRLRLKQDELFPVFSFEEVGDEHWFKDEIIEVDEALFAEWDEVSDKFFANQNKLGKLAKRQRGA